MQRAHLVFLLLFLTSSLASAVSLCDIKILNDCSNWDATTDFLNSQCEVAKSAANCNELYMNNPKVKQRSCRTSVSCPSSVSFAENFLSCRQAQIEVFGDALKGVGNFLMVETEMPPEMAERESFFRNCTTPQCKRDMLGPYANLFTKEEIEGHPFDRNVRDPNDPANAVMLQGLSAKTLYSELLIKLKKNFKNKTMEEPFLEPWSGATVDINKKKSFEDLINTILQKAGVKNTICYSPEVVAEMRCYAINIIIDPLMILKGVSAIARAAQLARPAEQVLEAIKATEQVEVVSKVKKIEIKPPEPFFSKASLPEVVPGSASIRNATIARYPGVARKVDAANVYTRSLEFPAPIKNLEDVDWSEYTKAGLSNMETMNLPKKLEKMTPEVKSAIKGVMNKMNDPESFISYMDDLTADTILNIEKRGKKTELDALKEGTIPQNAVLRVLVQRAKDRGRGNISTIVDSRQIKHTTKRKPNKNHDAFREAIAQGAFFDKFFQNAQHTMSSHFLQQDYVADVINTSTKGNPQKFWDYLGSKQGVHYWVPLFDSSYKAGIETQVSLTRPETTAVLVRRYTRFK